MFGLVVAGETVFALPFHVARFFRPILLDVSGLTATELGTAQGVYGAIAMIAVVGAWTDALAISDVVPGWRSEAFSNPHAKSVLQTKYILFESSGVADVSFEEAYQVFEREHILVDVQEACLEPTEGERDTAYLIHHDETKTNSYWYADKKGRRTDIVELYRGYDEQEETLRLVFFFEGPSAAGRIDALTVIHVSERDATQTDFGVQVYAYPKRGLVRFIARRFGFVKKRFGETTADIIAKVRDVADALCAPAATPATQGS